MPGSHVILIRNQREARRVLEEIGVDPGAYPYLLPKANFYCIKLKDISFQGANIIKQEMLSKGGEAAIPRQALSGEGPGDVLLMGTLKHYRLLLRKLKVQPFGLKKVATEIENILAAIEPKQQIIELPHGKILKLGERTLVMGILNITPDSFSDGGKYLNPDQAVKRAREMVDEGADIIDIGAASSRPDSVIAGEEEEINRLLPVMDRLVAEDIIISIDTFRGRVARAALENGAHIINDIGCLQLDSELLPVLVEKQAPVVLMHNRMQIRSGEPYRDLVADIITELEDAIGRAVDAGLPGEKIIVDPGIGFGKTLGGNRLLLKRLGDFRSLGKPILIGASRKSFIGQTLGLEVNERLEGSLAAVAIAIMNGADIIRVHDVKASKRVATMTDAVMQENG
ncbi:MAG TPA: dihydropteroate synthase [Syntrophomonas sp.]|nr:dihydropteroate synthase [Syntrophomonas sp.]